MIKYHPFAVSKNVKHIQNLFKQSEEIEYFYCALIELDYEIKTGKVPVSYFWLAVKKLIIRGR